MFNTVNTEARFKHCRTYNEEEISLGPMPIG